MFYLSTHTNVYTELVVSINDFVICVTINFCYIYMHVSFVHVLYNHNMYTWLCFTFGKGHSSTAGVLDRLTRERDDAIFQDMLRDCSQLQIHPPYRGTSSGHTHSPYRGTPSGPARPTPRRSTSSGHTHPDSIGSLTTRYNDCILHVLENSNLYSTIFLYQPQTMLQVATLYIITCIIHLCIHVHVQYLQVYIVHVVTIVCIYKKVFNLLFCFF